MKKIYIVLFGLISSLSHSQTYNRYYNSWRLGLNIGGMWQTADVRSTAGVAGGFTLEKGILENEMHFFSLAIRGRGLFGNTYGLDPGRNYNVKDNPALNGTYNPSIRYDTTTGYIYNNYRTQISEGALELQISFNRLRQKTGIILNLWGGVGLSGFRANTNLLGSDDKMYNYYKVDSAGTGDAGSILSANKNLMDKSYESYANGSKAKNLITFSPSAGIGLGYQLGQGASIVFEYKVTFPQGLNADYLDGITGLNNDPIAKHKDYYHYAGINFLFTLRGKGKSTQSSTNVSNYTPANTNTNTTYVPPTQTVSTSTPLSPPVVNITSPNYTPYNIGSANYTVKAKINNVTSKQQVSVNYNGVNVLNFNYYNGSIDFPVILNAGNNNVVISATNKAGSDSKSAAIVYAGAPPQITITNPSTNPYTSNSTPVTINANIINVSSSNDITAKFNGTPVNFFSYNLQNSLFSVQLPLVKGNNSLEIQAVNSFGRDSKTQTIIYSPVVNMTNNTASRPVVVTILDPATNPFTVKTSNYNVKAKVTSISSASQVTVNVNNAVTNFNYNAGSVTFNAPLNLGANNITVSANNGLSGDAKSTVIVYEMDRVVAPPKVTIIHPNPSPFTTNSSTFNFKAFVQQVNNRNQLEVKLNGNLVSSYSFNAESGYIDLASNLISGNNVFEVKATNADGNATGSGTVIYKIVSTELSLDPPITICHKNENGSRQTISILQSQWATHQAHGDVMGACPKVLGTDVNVDPDITICHKETNGARQTITIKESQWNLHQAHGDVKGACPNIQGEGVNLDPDMVICHKNNDGTKQTLTIKQSQWSSHQSHGDEQGSCPNLNAGDVNLDPEISICHKNADGTKQNLKIRQSQWSTHQAHGDVMGTCPKVNGGGDPGLDADITICHKNNDGSKQTLTIKQSQWADHQSHGDQMGACGRGGNVDMDLVICHKNSDGTKQTITIKQSEWSSHEAHGDVTGTCPIEDPDITICHKNADGSKETKVIKQSGWASHQAHGDVMGVCQTGSNLGGPKGLEDKKITICHIPPGNTGNPQTIEIPESAWPAHEAHGDTKGACAPNTGGNTGGTEKKITICHIPPGNTGNPQTIEIPESAWPAHEAHGDTKGACAPNTGGNTGGNEKKITICHIPPGNTGNPQTIEIPESAWPAHEAHGDTKGACAPNNNGNNGGGNTGGGNSGGNTGGGNSGGNEKKIKICHIPPGNTGNPQTIEIPESAWPAHEAHGDTKGECASSKKEGQIEAPKGRPMKTVEEQKTTPKETPAETPKEEPKQGVKPGIGRPR
jgi:hypothetical protein